MLRKVLGCLAIVALLAAGGCGTKPDLGALQTRAERGDAAAQYALGLRYYKGDGVQKNFVEAYTWLLIAKASAHRQEGAACKMLAKAMTPEQTAEAQARAEKWQQAHGQTQLATN